jgi:hypothetical protein
MYTEKTEYVLNKLGFFETKDGVYMNENQAQKIVLKPEGLYAFSTGRGYVDENDDYLELFLNFIPGDNIGDINLLADIIKRTFYL